MEVEVVGIELTSCIIKPDFSFFLLKSLRLLTLAQEAFDVFYLVPLIASVGEDVYVYVTCLLICCTYDDIACYNRMNLDLNCSGFDNVHTHASNQHH